MKRWISRAISLLIALSIGLQGTVEATLGLQNPAVVLRVSLHAPVFLDQALTGRALAQNYSIAPLFSSLAAQLKRFRKSGPPTTHPTPSSPTQTTGFQTHALPAAVWMPFKDRLVVLSSNHRLKALQNTLRIGEVAPAKAIAELADIELALLGTLRSQHIPKTLVEIDFDQWLDRLRTGATWSGELRNTLTQMTQAMDEVGSWSRECDEAFQRTVKESKGLARLDGQSIVIEEQLLPYLAEDLRKLGHSRVTTEALWDYFHTHEQKHELLRRHPELIESFIQKLQQTDLYEDSLIPSYAHLKEAFAHNFGSAFLDDKRFIEELIVLVLTEGDYRKTFGNFHLLRPHAAEVAIPLPNVLYDTLQFLEPKIRILETAYTAYDRKEIPGDSPTSYITMAQTLMKRVSLMGGDMEAQVAAYASLIPWIEG